MAVLHDTTASIGLTAGAAGVTNRSLTIAANAARFLIVHLAYYNASTTIPNGAATVKWNGTESLTLIYEVTTPGLSSALRLQCWGLKNPTAGSFNVTVTNGSGTIAGGSCAASSYYGVDQTTPYSTFYTDIQASTVLDQWIGTDSANNTKSVAALARSYGTDTAGIAAASKNSIPKFMAATTAVTGTVATLTPTLPVSPVPARGDYCFALCLSKNNATHSCSTSGWSKVGQTNSGASFTVSLWVAQVPVSGTLANPVITWSGSVVAAAKAWSLKDALGTNAALGAVATGTVATHTSAGGNTTAARSLAMYADGVATNAGLAVPSGWAEDNDQVAGAATGLANGSKEVATSGTASGAISVTGGAAAWVQQQRQISGGALQTSRATQLDLGGLRCLLKVDDEDGQTGFNQFGWDAPTTGAGGGPLAGVVNLNVSTAVFLGPITARHDNAQTFYAPTIKSVKLLQPALHTNAQTFYAPAVRTQIKPGLHTNAQTFNADKLIVTYKPTRFDNAQTFYAQAVSIPFAAPIAPFHTNTQTFYAPKVSFRLKPTRHDNTDTFYAPSVRLAYFVRPSSPHMNVQTFYAPARTATISETFRYDNAQTIYTTVNVGRLYSVTPGARFDNAQAFYGPQIAVVYKPSRYDNAQTFYAQTVRRVGAPIGAPPFVNDQVFYGPSFKLIVKPGLGTLIPPVNFFYTPVKLRLAYALAGLHTNANVFYSASVKRGDTHTTELFTNAQVFQLPRIGVTYKPTLHTNAQTFYPQTVFKLAFGVRLPPFFVNQQSFFGPTVYERPARPDKTPGAIGAGWYPEPGDPKKKKKPEPVLDWLVPTALEVPNKAPPWNPVVVTPAMAADNAKRLMEHRKRHFANAKRAQGRASVDGIILRAFEALTKGK